MSCDKFKFNNENIDTIIRNSWEKIRNLVENENQPLSSEKTLCFLFAMQVFKMCDEQIQFDFENQCYGDLQGKSKYLDLLIFTREGVSVAIEFKLPQKSKSGNSNQTETREAIYEI